MIALLGIAGVIHFSTTNELVAAVSSVPAATALLSILYTLVTEEIRRQRTEEAATRAEQLNVGIASHMAERVFDKHSAFCEEYTAEVLQVVVELTREGPTTKALNHAQALRDIRHKNLIWITNDIASLLIPFEAALRRIGANQHYQTSLPVGPDKSRVVEEIFSDLTKILELRSKPGDSSYKDSELAFSKIIHGLQGILGIEDLFAIRARMVSKKQ